ncbi:MAG: hypothetical protein LBF28_02190, partial [Rickettsiales bacterium]|nr:hypothetical protein [Rickettsiales bacterium]
MANNAKFLPERVSGALKNLALRGTGAALLLLGAWFAFALIFHDPYLDGFAATSSFGAQSLVDNIVGFLRFGIGFIPALFLFLCLAHTGLSFVMNWLAERAPEYNLLRGFIAVCSGSAGLGAMAPSMSLGGMAGSIAANDINWLLGGWTFLAGIVFFVIFLLMAAKLLHIGPGDLRALIRALYKTIVWLLSLFHLIKPSISEKSGEEEYEEDADEEKTARRAARKKIDTAAARQQLGRGKKSSGAGNKEYELPPPEFLEKSVVSKAFITPELKRNAAALETISRFSA